MVAAVASPSRRAAVAAASRKRRDPLSPSTTRTRSPRWPKEINALRPRIAVAGSASVLATRRPLLRIPAGSARRPAHRLPAPNTRSSPLFIVFFRCCCSELFLHMHPNYLFAPTDHRGRLSSARGSALPTLTALAAPAPCQLKPTGSSPALASSQSRGWIPLHPVRSRTLAAGASSAQPSGEAQAEVDRHRTRARSSSICNWIQSRGHRAS